MDIGIHCNRLLSIPLTSHIYRPSLHHRRRLTKRGEILTHRVHIGHHTAARHENLHSAYADADGYVHHRHHGPMARSLPLLDARPGAGSRRTPEYTHGCRPGKSGFGAHLSTFFLGLRPPNSSIFWNGLLGPPGFIHFPVTASKKGNEIGKNPIFSPRVRTGGA